MLGQLNKQPPAHLISDRQSLVLGRRRQSRQNPTILTGSPRFATIRDRRRVDRRVQTCGQTEVGVYIGDV